MAGEEAPGESPQHAPAIQERLERIRTHMHRILDAGLAISKADRGNLYPLDLLAFGALKRSISTSSAFIQLIEGQNMVGARTLLRVHIDTALRFSAAWLVEDPHVFARDVLKGDRIDLMKDRNGKPLTDKFLVEYHASRYPWLPDVYRNLSGYVHFSGSHITAPIARLGDHEAEVAISATDLHLPEWSWLEVLDCFLESSAICMHYIDGWILTKNKTNRNPDA